MQVQPGSSPGSKKCMWRKKTLLLNSPSPKAELHLLHLACSPQKQTMEQHQMYAIFRLTFHLFTSASSDPRCCHLFFLVHWIVHLHSTFLLNCRIHFQENKANFFRWTRFSFFGLHFRLAPHTCPNKGTPVCLKQTKQLWCEKALGQFSFGTENNRINFY